MTRLFVTLQTAATSLKSRLNREEGASAVEYGMLVALIAAVIGGPQKRLADAALVIATVSWFLGMVVAVLTERPIF